MTVDLDTTDWTILSELQRDARVAFTELARRVHLSASATTERVRRLEASGVIRGYSATVDLAKVGLPLLAIVRLKYHGNHHQPLHQLIQQREHVLECLRTTGEDCYTLKVAATSMPQLEEYVNELGAYGNTTTSLVYNQTLPYRGPQAPAPVSATADGAA